MRRGTKYITAHVSRFIFRTDMAIDNNAYPDRSNSDWLLRADSFRHAADILIDRWPDLSFLEKNTLLYPIIFNYRQYLELMFKDFIREGNRLINGKAESPNTHNLLDLWARSKNLIQERSLPIPDSELNQIERYIREFHSIDPSSEAFRYPVTIKGITSLRSNLHPISFPNLQLHMYELGELLENASGLLYADIDLEHEFQHDMYPEW